MTVQNKIIVYKTSENIYVRKMSFSFSCGWTLGHKIDWKDNFQLRRRGHNSRVQNSNR